jgi:hypothetical protein
MNIKNFKKRLITSMFLILLLGFSYNYSYILIISLIIVSLISWIEFKGLIYKIFKKKKFCIKIFEDNITRYKFDISYNVFFYYLLWDFAG